MLNRLLNNPKYHLIIFLVILLGCIFILLGRLYKTNSAVGGDAVYYYTSLRSIIIDRDINFKNEFEYFYNQRSPYTGNRKLPFILPENPETGNQPTKYPIGSAVFLIPPFLLTHSILSTLQGVGIGVTADGYNIIYQSSAALGSLLYAFLGLILIYSLGKKIFEPKIAFLATLAIWLATPLIYYMTLEPLTSQPISFFSVSAFVYLWYTTRNNRKLYQWISLGIIGGLMSIVRYQDSLFLLIPIVDQFRKLIPNLSKIFLFLFFAALIISVQLNINNYLFGSPFRTGEGDAGFPYLLSPKILYTLFSFERGLFVWSPVLVFASVGLYWFIRKFRLAGILLIISFFLQVYIVSSWIDPTQGDSFGNRILINSNVIFALGLMQFLKETKFTQRIFLIIFPFLVLVNGVLAGLFTLRIIGQPF